MRPEWQRLLQAARAARERAYAPYSNFAVGAALLGESGRIYAGCNVENASYGATLCAERTAVGSAVAGGERRFVAIAVVADTSGPCAPCGVCRQVLAEFGAEIQVIMANLQGAVEVRSVQELLPYGFGKEMLAQGGAPGADATE